MPPTVRVPYINPGLKITPETNSYKKFSHTLELSTASSVSMAQIDKAIICSHVNGCWNR